MPDKPALRLVENPDVEELVRLFKELTGREPTPDEIEEARWMLEDDE